MSKWINANRQLPLENVTVLLIDLKREDLICKAKYGTWTASEGIYTSWHINGTFINYIDAGQYWMEIPELP